MGLGGAPRDGGSGVPGGPGSEQPGPSLLQASPCARVISWGPVSLRGLPSGSAVKNLPQCRNHRRPGFDPWVRRIPGGGHGNPLQSSCLESPMDRGAWRAAVHRVAQSQTQPKWLSTHACTQASSSRQLSATCLTSQAGNGSVLSTGSQSCPGWVQSPPPAHGLPGPPLPTSLLHSPPVAPGCPPR